MTRLWRTFTGTALELALLAGGPATSYAVAAPAMGAAVDFLPDWQAVVLALPANVVPDLHELERPPALVLDFLGGAEVPTRDERYAEGLVSRFIVVHSGSRTRVVLMLRHPLKGSWRLAYVGDRLVVGLGPGKLPSIAALQGLAAPRPVPAAAPTPRPHPSPKPTPVPSPVPTSRITPMPVPGASFEPLPLPGLPSPEPSPPPTPIPSPIFVPEPLPSAVEESDAIGLAVFGGRFSAGTEVALDMAEVYPQGHSDSHVAMVPGTVFALDSMFTPNWGLALSGRAISYTLKDEAQAAVVEVLHRRDDYEGGLGVRGRWPLPWGFELMGQPGVLVRMVQASTTASRQGAAATDASGSDYLSTGWLGYGGSVGGGLGWHIWGPLSLAATGDYNLLFGGTMFKKGVPAIFPMSGYRVGADVRLEFGGFGLSAGYGMGNYSHTGADAATSLSQDWAGPTARLSWVF